MDNLQAQITIDQDVAIATFVKTSDLDKPVNSLRDSLQQLSGLSVKTVLLDLTQVNTLVSRDINQILQGVAQNLEKRWLVYSAAGPVYDLLHFVGLHRVVAMYQNLSQAKLAAYQPLHLAV